MRQLYRHFYATKPKKIIKAAQTAWNLLLEGFTELPDNVSQAERLSNSARQVSEEADETVNCWSKVLEMSKKEGKGLTAKYIEKTITGEETKPMASAKLPRKYWEKLGKKAKKMGKSTQELLEEIVEDYLEGDLIEEPEGDTPPASDGQLMTDKLRNIESEPWFKEMTEDCRIQSTINKNYDTSPDS